SRNDIFCDRLTLARHKPIAMLNGPTRTKPMPESGPLRHLLLVADARHIREPLVRYLKESGYRASAADSAAAARRAMRTSGIDLVILGIMMPGGEGLSLCRSLRANCWRASALCCAGPTRCLHACGDRRPSATGSASGPSTRPSVRSWDP